MKRAKTVGVNIPFMLHAMVDKRMRMKDAEKALGISRDVFYKMRTLCPCIRPEQAERFIKVFGEGVIIRDNG